MGERGFVTTEDADGALVVRIVCDQLAEREAQIVLAEAAEAAAGAGWRIAVDVSRVAFMPSAGLGALVNLHNQARAAGGKMAVFGVGDELDQMLRLTHLNKLLLIKKDQAAAVKAAR